MKNNKLSTKALHAGYDPFANLNSRAVPIYDTTSYNFQNIEEGADLFALKKIGYIYTRIGNPTVDVLEKRLAAYHDAAACVAFSCGAAANTALFMTLAGPGNKIIASPHLYGGTIALLEHTLRRFGINTVFVDLNDEKALRAAIDENVALVFAEAVANPSGYIVDIEKVAAIAHEFNLPLAVDNSSTPPPLLNPLDYGADILTYSLTKMICGHGTHLGGALIEKGSFNWGKNKVFASHLNAPDSAYNGLNFWDAFGAPNIESGQGMALALKVRLDHLRDTGAALSPFGAHDILLGLETLPLRAKLHASNALQVAEFLSKHPKVAWVNYSGLEESPNKPLCDKYFGENGPGAVFGIGLKGGYNAAVNFINRLDLFSNLANILDARSLVIHPASTTHQQLSAQEKLNAGVPDDLIRLSIGLEDINDILDALASALE